MLKQNSIDAHNIWDSAGRPKFGEIWQKQVSAKQLYKRSIKHYQLQESNSITNELNDHLLNKNMTNFWRTWKLKFAKPKCSSPNVIEGESDPVKVCEMFADSFKTACTPNSNSRNEQLHHDFLEKYNSYILEVNNNISYDLSVEAVDNCVRQLKQGKAAGADGLMAEHFLNAHPIVIVELTKYFNALLRHHYVPNFFGLGIIIPLVKDMGGDLTSLNNFRGITLSPTMSKIFEMCLISLFEDYLLTHDLQVGFKKNLGCNHALYMLRSVIEHYNANDTTVTICSLDMSKAFDKVNHSALFMKLMDRDVPLVFLNILIEWYSKCFASVKWNNCLSSKFSISCGVRQGGVLSPLLFSVYINDVILKLQNSRRGCFIGHMYFGCILYADDIILISPSNTGMQDMLDICDIEIKWLDMKFNVKKSMAMRVGSRYSVSCAPLLIDNVALEYVETIKYLGITLKSEKKFTQDVHALKCKFFRALNGIYSKCGSKMSEIVLIELIQSYCLPFLTYCSESFNLNKETVAELSSCWRKAVRKIFSLPPWSSINQILMFTSVLPLEYIIDQRRLNFIVNIQNIENERITWISEICKNSNYREILVKYDANLKCSKSRIKFLVWDSFSRSMTV